MVSLIYPLRIPHRRLEEYEYIHFFTISEQIALEEKIKCQIYFLLSYLFILFLGNVHSPKIITITKFFNQLRASIVFQSCKPDFMVDINVAFTSVLITIYKLFFFHNS